MRRSWWVVIVVALFSFSAISATGIGLWLSLISTFLTVVAFILISGFIYFLIQDLKQAPVESIVLIVLVSLLIILNAAILVKVW